MVEKKPLSPLIRWILAIVIALALIFVIVGVFYFGLMAMAFGADSCSQVGDDTSLALLIAAGAAMAVGVIVAAILFGFKKRWQLWLGALAVGGALGVCGYVSWFAFISQLCG